MRYLFSPGRQVLSHLLTLFLLLLCGRVAQAQCTEPYLSLVKTSQGGISCNCSSTYRLKASSTYPTGYFRFKLQANGYFSTVNVQPDADGMTVLISNLVGYASYDVTVIYYDGSGCSATTTQTVVIPADTPGGGGGGGGGSPPQQEESSFTSTHPTSNADASISALPTSLSAYPNPASDVLLVPVAAQAAGSTVHLLDQLGRVVRRLPVGTSTSLSLDTRELSDGLYYLRVPGAPGKGQAIQIRH
ncbi:MAG: T9SS type A sorting domain-containing protein [Hymenobacter sp.]|nr:MAG: T9SS type A sorting domain-containing protein [Hymenobacter sp.]